MIIDWLCTDDGIVIEFKVHDPEDEKTLADTVAFALAQKVLIG
jgi:hypothetical protein